MESGDITDSQITASSEASSALAAKYARLNLSPAWSAQINNLDQWIQVDLVDIVQVTGVMTQGVVLYNQWVTKYKVEYSTDNDTWVTVMNAGNQVSLYRGG